MHLDGTVLRGPSFEPVEGRVVVDGGEIVSIEEMETTSDDIILPAFVNAHTHLGDSIAKEAGGDLSLEELVAPPDGLKHRLLREASRDELVEGIRRSLQFMESTGTGTCLEFREGGVEGVRMFREAAEYSDLQPLILGRETIDAMQIADGFGASGANDADFETERTATGRLANCSASTPARWTQATSTPHWISTRTSSSTWSIPIPSTSSGSTTARSRSSSVRVRTSLPTWVVHRSRS